MTASEAEQMVREEYPMARLYHSPVIGYVISHRDEDVDYSDGDTSEDAAWISAASRLPAPKPIEPAHVESGDGPEREITIGFYLVQQKFNVNWNAFAYELDQSHKRGLEVLLELAASLQRERELVELLRGGPDHDEDAVTLIRIRYLVDFGCRDDEKWQMAKDLLALYEFAERVSSR